MPQVRATDIFALYHQISQIFDRVLPHPTVGEIRASTRGNFPPVFGVESGKGTRFFPNLKRDDWIDVLCPATSVNPHPLKVLGYPQARIHKTLSEYVSLRRCLLPVVHEVMLRMCVLESCTAIETVEHCFLSCPALEEMWRSLWVPWGEFLLVALDWRLLLFTKPSDLKLEWRQRHKTLLVLWRVHTAIVFHATWRLRNDIHFRETRAKRPSTQATLSILLLSCSGDYVDRQLSSSQVENSMMKRILSQIMMTSVLVTQKIWMFRSGLRIPPAKVPPAKVPPYKLRLKQDATPFRCKARQYGLCKYLLLLTDNFTHFYELVPCDTPTSEIAVGSLLSWHNPFGVPPVWISDQRSHFKNEPVGKWIRGVCKQTEMYWAWTTKIRTTTGSNFCLWFKLI
ncbi:hypothetical protein P3T76_002535 [Phytophthora citrophthora]|uniref:Integrase catalytic domain-containing protein n=1 Tax=Phytophthora citrophthora TaxID=4793 RepID=A0AAD9LSF7_9STRA|nr:hypothetical protein P3T76_002535 [Phytophthora citrophthora]